MLQCHPRSPWPILGKFSLEVSSPFSRCTSPSSQCSLRSLCRDGADTPPKPLNSAELLNGAVISPCLAAYILPSSPVLLHIIILPSSPVLLYTSLVSLLFGTVIPTSFNILSEMFLLLLLYNLCFMSLTCGQILFSTFDYVYTFLPECRKKRSQKNALS